MNPTLRPLAPTVALQGPLALAATPVSGLAKKDFDTLVHAQDDLFLATNVG